MAQEAIQLETTIIENPGIDTEINTDHGDKVRNLLNLTPFNIVTSFLFGQGINTKNTNLKELNYFTDGRKLFSYELNEKFYLIIVQDGIAIELDTPYEKDFFINDGLIFTEQNNFLNIFSINQKNSINELFLGTKNHTIQYNSGEKAIVINELGIKIIIFGKQGEENFNISSNNEQNTFISIGYGKNPTTHIGYTQNENGIIIFSIRGTNIENLFEANGNKCYFSKNIISVNDDNGLFYNFEIDRDGNLKPIMLDGKELITTSELYSYNGEIYNSRTDDLFIVNNSGEWKELLGNFIGCTKEFLSTDFEIVYINEKIITYENKKTKEVGECSIGQFEMLLEESENENGGKSEFYPIKITEGRILYYSFKEKEYKTLPDDFNVKKEFHEVLQSESKFLQYKGKSLWKAFPEEYNKSKGTSEFLNYLLG